MKSITSQEGPCSTEVHQGDKEEPKDRQVLSIEYFLARTQLFSHDSTMKFRNSACGSLFVVLLTAGGILYYILHTQSLYFSMRLICPSPQCRLSWTDTARMF